MKRGLALSILPVCACAVLAMGCSPSSPEETGKPFAELRALPKLTVAAVGDNVYVGLRLRWAGASERKVDIGATVDNDIVADLTGDFSLDGSSGNTEDSILFRCVKAGTAEVTATMTFQGAWAPDSATIECVDPEPDPANDLFYSDSSLPATFLAPYIDILGFKPMTVTLTAEQAADLSGLAKDPSLANDGPIVGEAPNAAPIVMEDVMVVLSRFAGPIPRADTGHSLTYGAVFASDDSTANDWVPQGSFDFDQYQGADLWYEMRWDKMAASWGVRATRVADDQSTAEQPTRARSFIFDRAIVWFIPRSEVATDAPIFRVTSFGHGGNFSPSDSGGDVNGANPTLPMIPF